ncbi:NUDIX hydrolase [Butyrivibrio sp. WCD3002]|uniref:NUDIX hydrolase n=1 Tax=Butyrivibrio sp. WCD3002 TaxID=1280676 RepID=UPI000405A022|nr:NUDIX domain-containing protein [Butyrivibrio sp. WCD3002]
MNALEYVESYKNEGGYIKALRKHVGHAPLITIGVGTIIENDKGEILLQKRKDNGMWGIVGGGMELGENFEDVARREAREEAGIELGELRLRAICNGPDRFITYPNGDICYTSAVVFWTNEFFGEIKNDSEEVFEHRFFGKDDLPEEINGFDKIFIDIWQESSDGIAIYDGKKLSWQTGGSIAQLSRCLSL